LVIIEVLSKTTQEYDRGLRFASYQTIYQTIESLREYVTIARDSAHAECWRIQPDGDWTVTEYGGLDAVISLKTVAVELPLAEVYRKLNWRST